MKITKRKLKRIIKEESQKLYREGWTHGDEVFDSLFQILDQSIDDMGVDRFSPEGSELVATALEKIASEIRSESESETRFKDSDMATGRY